MRAITAFAGAATIGFILACKGEPLAQPRDVSGNYEIVYADNLRVYIDDTLVAEVQAGENATIEWNGETFDVAAVCGDDGTTCPSEAYWGAIGIEQPWGSEYRLLNFVNLDPARPPLGQRMGGLLEDDGSFGMLAGLDLDGSESCASIGIGVVEGKFDPANTAIQEGVIKFGWAGGCTFGGVTIGTNVRLETDVTAVRTGPLDLSGLTPEPPIDENGEEIDETKPDPDAEKQE
ncbi:MAG: hypothetical protein H6737_19050 [Alphaproteobacteria bacterium]|nr:hypothetical protein [Alphaproteobacteria bacterium]